MLILSRMAVLQNLPSLKPTLALKKGYKIQLLFSKLKKILFSIFVRSSWHFSHLFLYFNMLS